MARTTAKPITLSFRSEVQVVVEPDDSDRFVTTAAEAARACQQAQAGQEFRAEFEHFLSFVHGWCITHKDKVDRAFVDIGDGGLRVNICMKSADFDFEFDDKVTDLDIELLERYPKCIAEVTQFPGSIGKQLEPDSEFAVIVYGDGSGTSESGQT
jgi:hypothetical protein